MALRNGSETPGSKPLIFGLNVFIATGRVDHARSAVFVPNLCSAISKPSVTQPFVAECSAVPRRPRLLYCRVPLQ